MQQLQPGTTLQGGKYKIERVLGQGGFGITYLALNTMLDGKVAIKEFFMKEFCNRHQETYNITCGVTSANNTVEQQKAKFLKEARNLFKLSHPNIIRIQDVFEENNTVYYVMEYCSKGSLADMVNAKGYLSEQEAAQYVIQVAEALKCIHACQLNHLDVKPANIMLNSKGDAVLIDFGLSKQYDLDGQQTSTTPIGVSEGYAPLEQYKQGGVREFSPETDIYSLGATFYKLLTGKTPPTASDIYEDGVPLEELKNRGVSQAAMEVILRAMNPRKRDRTKNADDVISSLDTNKGSQNVLFDSDEETCVQIKDEVPVEKNNETTREGSMPLKKTSNSLQSVTSRVQLFATIILMAIISFTAYTFLHNGDRDEEEVPEPIQTETPHETEYEQTESHKQITPKAKEMNSEQSQIAPRKEENKVKTEQAQIEKEKPEVVKDDNAQKLKEAIQRGDYTIVQKLANQGYSPAYAPLAKYYLEHHEYNEADRYAKKAKAAGQGDAQSVITALENLGYYD